MSALFKGILTNLGIEGETFVTIIVIFLLLGFASLLFLLIFELRRTYQLYQTDFSKFKKRLWYYALQFIIIVEVLLVVFLLIGRDVLGGFAGFLFWFLVLVAVGLEITRRRITRILA